MGTVVKCGESIELIQKVLEEIERKIPPVLWLSGSSPASWNPKIADDGSHVAIFVSDTNKLTYIKDSKEYVEYYISSHHRSDDIIYAEDFIDGETTEDIQNETDISFLFN